MNRHHFRCRPLLLHLQIHRDSIQRHRFHKIPFLVRTLIIDGWALRLLPPRWHLLLFLCFLLLYLRPHLFTCLCGDAYFQHHLMTIIPPFEPRNELQPLTMMHRRHLRDDLAAMPTQVQLPLRVLHVLERPLPFLNRRRDTTLRWVS